MLAACVSSTLGDTVVVRVVVDPKRAGKRQRGTARVPAGCTRVLVDRTGYAPLVPRRDVVVVGAGLAGLSCVFELGERRRDVLLVEAREVLGGRTSSWYEDGMPVESGLHRFLGMYEALPRLLERAGIRLDEIVVWEDEVEVAVADGPRAVLGLSPLHKPLTTIGGALGNNDFLSPREKARLGRFFAAGLWQYSRNPAKLDEMTVLDYARRHGVSERAIEHVLVPLTAGIFFLPQDRYAAHALFALTAPAVRRAHRMRVGAFAGGMTEVMAAPLAAAIERQGGEVRMGTTVTSLVTNKGRVEGVEVRDETVEAEHVVVATSLGPAQELVRNAFGEHESFAPLLRLPSMPAVTIQLELTQPAMPIDRTTFAPGTALASFAEQSRTTFPEARGRLSIILSPPERFLDLPSDEVLRMTCEGAERIGVALADKVARYRVVAHREDFYSLSPGTEALRPAQKTPVEGLTLAGDYTRQPLVTTMEGAVLSGERAALALLED